MKLMRHASFIAYVMFMISIYLGFVYTLSMLTDVTTLNFFADFLDPSVQVYVDEAQIVNKELFRMSFILVAVSVILHAFKFRKGDLGLVRLGISSVVAVVAIIINILSLSQMQALNQSYLLTDTTWGYPIAPEVFGYVEPSNFFVGSGPVLYLVLTIISGGFLLVTLVCLARKLGRKHS